MLERIGFATPRGVGFDVIGNRMVDFDGDHVADALIGGVQAPENIRPAGTGSRTAITRSGLDGRVIWKTEIDPLRSWFNQNSGDAYELSAFPLPEGDLDGDGTADVIVKKKLTTAGSLRPRTSTLSVELLSGRTGARVWSGGPFPSNSIAKLGRSVDWIETRLIEAGGGSDLVIGHSDRSGRPYLAQGHGHDGRIRWEVRVSEELYAAWFTDKKSRYFADLDGDGGLDVLIALPQIPNSLQQHWIYAVSLRDGKQLWPQPLQLEIPYGGEIHVGDLDGDRRPDVVAQVVFSAGLDAEQRIRAFDGRDGKLRWSWTIPGARFSPKSLVCDGPRESRRKQRPVRLRQLPNIGKKVVGFRSSTGAERNVPIATSSTIPVRS